LQRANDNREILDGAVSYNGLVWGTYIHDIFKNDSFRRELINYLREKKGLNKLKENTKFARKEREKSYNYFAKLLRNNLDMEKLYEIIGVNNLK